MPTNEILLSLPLAGHGGEDESEIRFNESSMLLYLPQNL
jgi:hypothetical protein